MALVNGSVDHHLRGRRVEKVWRTVRWAQSFPDDHEDGTLDMDAVDLTPPFAIRKIANMFERQKFLECASIIGRLHGITLSSILVEVPIEKLHDALPGSLPIIESLYVKVHKSHPAKFPTGQLMTDHLVKRLVTVFAHNPAMKEFEKSTNVNCCRTILSIILSFETGLKDIIFQRKRAIDRCLRNMGKHGLVDSSGGKLMLLHDALKVEFEKILIQYKCALQKLDELSLSAKHPMATSVSSGPAPSEASHQRLMQVERAEVQDRIIKNKTLHNVVEPAISNQYVRKLTAALQRRIEYDKILLFHDTELRKMSEGITNHNPNPAIILSQSLRQFSQGYGQLLTLIANILGEEVPQDHPFEDSSFEDEEKDGGVSITSTLSILERMKIISLNGVIPAKGLNLSTGHLKGSGRDSLSTIEENNNTALSPFAAATQPSYINTTATHNTSRNKSVAGSPLSSSTVIISQAPSGYGGEKSTHYIQQGGSNNGHKSQFHQNHHHHHHHLNNNHNHRDHNQHHNNPHHPHHYQHPIHNHNNHQHHNYHHHQHQIKRANVTTPYISYPIPMGMEVASQQQNHLLLQNNSNSNSNSNINSNINSSNININNSNGGISSNTQNENNELATISSPRVSMLETEIHYLRDELAQSRDLIQRLQEQETQLRERLSTFVHNQFATKSSSAFEDLNLGSLRPTSLIRSYDDLYRDGRIDTLDALDALAELKGLDILKMKILFSVVVLSFRCVQQSLHELKGRLRHTLCLPQGPNDSSNTSHNPGDVAWEMEQHINNYLCKTIDTHDITPMIQEVCQNIYATLYDYPGLKACGKLADYAKTTVRLAWGLTVQNPPFYIMYDSQRFQEQSLSRFHTSDSESDDVKSFLWPILVDGQTGQCVAKGVVIT